MGKVLCTVCSSVAHLCFVELTANQRENFCTVLSQMCFAQICTKHEIVLEQDNASFSRHCLPGNTILTVLFNAGIYIYIYIYMNIYMHHSHLHIFG